MRGAAQCRGSPLLRACRLYVLLSALPSLQGRLAELSSLNSTAQRAAALAAFRVPDGQVALPVSGFYPESSHYMFSPHSAEACPVM